jgi:hypothetical protein
MSFSFLWMCLLLQVGGGGGGGDVGVNRPCLSIALVWLRAMGGLRRFHQGSVIHSSKKVALDEQAKASAVL